MIKIVKFIEQARKTDIDEINNIFVDVTRWLRSMNVLQWDFSYPNKDVITSDIQSNSCFVVRIEGIIAAVVTLNQDQDPQYKKIKWEANDEGIWVIHRLAVSPDFQNQRIASQLCIYLEDLVKSSKGKAIRLDAYSKNPYSNKMYLKLDFKPMKEYLFFHGNDVPFNAYEKIISE